MTPKHLAENALAVFKHAAFDPHAMEAIQHAMETAIAAERKRCRRIAIKQLGSDSFTAASRIADAIESGEDQ